MDFSRFATDDFFDFLYEREERGQSLRACLAEDFETVARQKRAELRRVLALERLEAMAAPLPGPLAQPVGSVVHGDVTMDVLSLSLLPGLCTPLYVLMPASPLRDSAGQVKTLLYCQPHGNTFTQALQNGMDPGDPMEVSLARLGYRVIMPELTGFGAAVRTRYKDPDFAGCYACSMGLLSHGLNMAGLRVFTLGRAMAWAEEALHCGPMVGYGMSGGGLVLTLLGALDPTLRACAVASFLCTQKASIHAMRHCADNYVPGLLSIGESAELLMLGAPRKLLISHGEQDPIFPIAHTRLAARQVMDRYASLGQGHRVRCEFFDGGHEISRREIGAWLSDAFV